MFHTPHSASWEVWKFLCPIEGMTGKTYQEWLDSLPVKKYGWGLRSLKDTCGPAYLGAIPFMAARYMICPAWGGEHCWGEGASSDSRW